MWNGLVAGSVAIAIGLLLLSPALPGLSTAPPTIAPTSTESSSILFADHFERAHSLASSDWATSGPELSALAYASSSPGSVLVPPQLRFMPSLGLRMSGPTGDYQFTGIESRRAFTPPIVLAVNLTALRGCADVFAVYLTSANLSDYLAVLGNFPASNGPYYGAWVTNSPTDSLYQFGPLLYGSPQYYDTYHLRMTIDSHGSTTTSIVDDGKVVGSVHTASVGAGPFRVTLAERIGLPYCATGPMAVIWHSVKVVRGEPGEDSQISVMALGTDALRAAAVRSFAE